MYYYSIEHQDIIVEVLEMGFKTVKYKIPAIGNVKELIVISNKSWFLSKYRKVN